MDDQTAPLLRPRQANRFTVLGTQITAPSAAGATTITVESTGGFNARDILQIMLDTGANFRTGLVSISGDVMTLASPLPASVGTTYGDIENGVLAIDTSGAGLFVLDVPGYDILGFGVLA